MKKDLEKFVAEHRAEFDDQDLPQGTWEKIQANLPITTGGGQQNDALPPSVAGPAKGRLAFLRPRNLAWTAAAAILVWAAWMGLFRQSAQTEVLVAPLVKTVPQNPPTSPAGENETMTTAPQTDPSLVPENKTLANAVKQNTPTLVSVQPAFAAQKAQLCNAIVDMESAATRYAAANAIEKMSCVDPDILQVLVKTMNTDPNTNVRLAAVESLGKFYREPYVKKALIRSLQEQKDPVVQVALIDLLGKMRSRALVKELEKLVQDQNTSQPVKDQAYSNLLRYQ